MAEPNVVVVGAGQAGLAVSHHLTTAGVPHTVLERRRVAQTWRGRWDSFCLVTPNWTLSLPGFAYDGDEPEGFVPRDEIVHFLERYAASFAAPVEEGVDVVSLDRAPGGRLRLQTSAGDLEADHVVLATGAYQRPHRPAVGIDCPPGVAVLDAESYTQADALPPGRVLVVGSGQTGCQLAEDLTLAGRDVVLACGRAPWGPRRLEGTDIVTWLSRTRWFEVALGDLPSPAARLLGNIQLTGRDGGHDLHYRVLRRMGVELVGHLRGIAAGRAEFEDDLAASVAFGDARYEDMVKALREQLSAAGFAPPDFPELEPFAGRAATEVRLDAFGAVVFTSGFRPDYTRWVDLNAFDEMGFPLAADGICAAEPGLYFVGVHFLRKRKSSLLWGVGEDASIVAATIAKRVGAATAVG